MNALLICFRINFSYQMPVCNSFHEILQRSSDFNEVAIVTVKGNDSRSLLGYA